MYSIIQSKQWNKGRSNITSLIIMLPLLLEMGWVWEGEGGVEVYRTETELNMKNNVLIVSIYTHSQVRYITDILMFHIVPCEVRGGWAQNWCTLKSGKVLGLGNKTACNLLGWADYQSFIRNLVSVRINFGTCHMQVAFYTVSLIYMYTQCTCICIVL